MIKTTRKTDRSYGGFESKIPPGAPAIWLVTENVLVPITKAVFKRKPGTGRCNIFGRRTSELVKPRKRTENLSISLLREPSYLSANGHGSGTVLQSKQVLLIFILSLCSLRLRFSSGRKERLKQNVVTFQRGASTKGKYPGKSMSRLIDGASTFPIFRRVDAPSQHAKNETKRSLRRRAKALPFPFPISDVPDKLCEPNRKPVSSNADEDTAPKVSRALTNVSEAGSISFQLLNDSREPDRLFADTLMTIFDKEVELATTTIKNNLYCREEPSTEATAIEEAASTNAMNLGEELEFPASWTESRVSDRVRFTIFDVSTSQNFHKRNEKDMVPEMIRSTRGPRYSRQETDRSSFSSAPVARENRFLCCTDRGSPEDEYPCRLKYSWQVLGRSAQTSRTLLQSCLAKVQDDVPGETESVYDCKIKYSWQIIGIATQTSPADFNLSDCRSVVSFLIPKRNGGRLVEESASKLPVTVQRNGKLFFLLNNQCTQTSAHKESQTNFSEIHAKCH